MSNILIILLLISCFKTENLKSEKIVTAENLNIESTKIDNSNSVLAIKVRTLNISNTNYYRPSIDTELDIKSRTLIIGIVNNFSYSSVCTRIEELETFTKKSTNYITENLLNILTSSLLENRDVILKGLDEVITIRDEYFINIRDIEVETLIIDDTSNFGRLLTKNIRNIKAKNLLISNSSNKVFIKYIKRIKAKNIILDNINNPNKPIHTEKLEHISLSALRSFMSIILGPEDKDNGLKFLSSCNSFFEIIGHIEDITVETLTIKFINKDNFLPIGFIGSIEGEIIKKLCNIQEDLNADSLKVDNSASALNIEPTIRARILNIGKIKYHIPSIDTDLNIQARIMLIGNRINNLFDNPNSLHNFDNSLCTKLEELETNFKTKNLLDILTSHLLENKDIMLEGKDTVDDVYDQYLINTIVDIKVKHLIIDDNRTYGRYFARNIKRIKAKTLDISNINCSLIRYIKRIKAKNIILDNIYNLDEMDESIEKVPYDPSVHSRLFRLSICVAYGAEQLYLLNSYNSFINYIEEIIVDTLIIRNIKALSTCPVQFIESIEAITLEVRETKTDFPFWTLNSAK